MKEVPYTHVPDWVDGLRERLARLLHALQPRRVPIVAAYLAVTVAVAVGVGVTLGREIFPPSDARQFQLRFRAPAGTKFEVTKRMAIAILDEIAQAARPGHIEMTLGYVGVHPPSYPINTIFLWTGGSHEGVLQVALGADVPTDLADFEESLRARGSRHASRPRSSRSSLATSSAGS
jgi:multidrug efflux pump subunit AcrB